MEMGRCEVGRLLEIYANFDADYSIEFQRFSLEISLVAQEWIDLLPWICWWDNIEIDGR